MNSLLQKLSVLYRDWNDSHRLLSASPEARKIVFYSEDIASYNQFEGYIKAILDASDEITYVSSDANDPIFDRGLKNLKAHYTNLFMPSFMARLDSQVLVTTMPDLGKLHVKRPPSCCQVVYIFHSLNSIHEVYQEGAFDHYDHFFCAGPHHKLELETHFKAIGKRCPELHSVGYYKLDRVSEQFNGYTSKSTQTTVLVAPSWGSGNLLETHGESVVEQLLSEGFRVIVRPHPCFFLPIYPQGSQCVREILKRFGGHENFTLEDSIVDESSFFEADLMISDFSGAAFEYAFGTERPVLFIDVARKTKNKNWRNLGLDTFEDKIRHKVGKVVNTESIHKVGNFSSELLGSQQSYRELICEVRRKAIYNFGKAAETGAQIIRRLVET